MPRNDDKSDEKLDALNRLLSNKSEAPNDDLELVLSLTQSELPSHPVNNRKYIDIQSFLATKMGIRTCSTHLDQDDILSFLFKMQSTGYNFGLFKISLNSAVDVKLKSIVKKNYKRIVSEQTLQLTTMTEGNPEELCKEIIKNYIDGNLGIHELGIDPTKFSQGRLKPKKSLDQVILQLKNDAFQRIENRKYQSSAVLELKA